VRHFLLAAVLVVLATASVAESAKTPRRGGGPAVVPPSFFENTSVRTLVTDGFCSGGHNVVNAGPAVHDQKVFIAYGQRPANGLSCIGNAFDVKAFRAWNYTDGSGVTGMVTVDTVQVFFGTGGHDMPAIVASSNGTESVIYGGEQLGLCCPPAHAPGVKETTVADDTSSFGSMTRVPISGGTSENVCGYDTNGTLHCVGQKQSIASGGTDRGRAGRGSSARTLSRAGSCARAARRMAAARTVLLGASRTRGTRARPSTSSSREPSIAAVAVTKTSTF